MANILLTRDEDACVKCGECIDVCPHSGENSLVNDPVIVQKPDEVPYIANPENCIGCLSCKDICRAEAIYVEGIEEITSLLTNMALLEKIKRII